MADPYKYFRVEAREQHERFEAQIDQERVEHQRQRTELQECNAVLARERDGLQQSLAAAQEHSRQLDVGLRSGVLPPFCAFAQSSTVAPVMATT